MNQWERNQALANAVEQGDTASVHELLAQGADPNDSEALHYAVRAQSLNPLLHLLLERGADPNAEAYERITPLFVASGRNGSPAAVRLLLAAGARIEHRCDDGNTALMWAAYQRDWVNPDNPLVTLLEAGADANVSNEHGGSVPTTALIWAATAGHMVNVRILLAYGADPNLVDCQGNTALHVAAAAGHLQIVRDLLAHGAHPEVTDSNGDTALQLAERHCRQLLDLLSREA